MSGDDQTQAFFNSEALNDEFFNSIVENKLGISRDKFKVRLVLLLPATGSNENFVSVLYRAKIKVELLETKERTSVDVIIKALLSTLEDFKEFSVFPRERFMYENVIKSFEKIWLDRANEVIEFGPKCLKVESEPYEIIVMDDLKANGYVMEDRKVGLSAAHTKVALSKLAKFHAASAVRYQNEGIIQDFLVLKNSFPAEWLKPDGPLGLSFFSMLDGFIERLRLFGNCDSYADKIAKWDRQKLMNFFVDVAEPMKCGFTVLAHADCWMNNMMFKSNDANEVEDVAIIDFQTCSWASPALDLHYFITSSVHDDVKVECYDELMKHYYEVLSESLRKLKYDKHIPTLEEFYEDLLDKSGQAAQSSFYIMIVTKYESAEVMKMEDFMKVQDKEFIDRIYCNETFKKAVKLWLPFFDKRGYLDSFLPDNGHVVNGN